MATIDGSQAEEMLRALGEDLRWRLIKADDPHYSRGDRGHWLENSRETIGRHVTDMPLNRLDDQYSWHVRPMPRGGPYRLTLLDDATQETIVRMRDEGLPPTAVVQTSDNSYQVWHRWPWAIPRQKIPRLLRHLQQHFRTDSGSNIPGQDGRLAGTRNWKRMPVDRGGCPVALVETNPQLTPGQAKAWFIRHPVVVKQPQPKPVPPGRTTQFDLDDPRYQEIRAKGLSKLPGDWAADVAKKGYNEAI